MEEQGKQDEGGVDDVRESGEMSLERSTDGSWPHMTRRARTAWVRTPSRQFGTTSAGALMVRSATRGSYQ